MLSDEATVVLSRHNAEVELSSLDVEIEVDGAFHQAMEEAWLQELSHAHVSQGAYVSRAQYEEAAASRLLLVGQAGHNSVMWPPRFSHLVDGAHATQQPLRWTGAVQTWTTLSAAGAPSEFSLRAPLLGGISTVLLNLDDGPNGVFLTVDDEDAVLEMDARMELVVRRLYAKKDSSVRLEKHEPFTNNKAFTENDGHHPSMAGFGGLRKGRGSQRQPWIAEGGDCPRCGGNPKTPMKGCLQCAMRS